MTETRVDRYRQLFVQIGEQPARDLLDGLQVLGADAGRTRFAKSRRLGNPGGNGFGTAGARLPTAVIQPSRRSSD